MAYKDIVKHQFNTTDKRAQEIGRKGGQAKTEIKKWAAKLRCIKQRMRAGQIKPGDPEWLLTRLLSSHDSAAYLMGHLDDMLKNPDYNLDPDLKLKILGAYSNAHKLVHGEKHKTEISGNLTLNINSDIEAAYREIKNITPTS